ncbi:DUF1641 domain-containing protein [Litchfieldella xinjiangensis]|uniref:DUF1641 domain-containing protein n=1 Tax=Litchfieldella xinjiangensis TaxID=1166948 RepID=UPI0005BC0930|nr:hypothetical protein [Halomonas xinjiangensis]
MAERISHDVTPPRIGKTAREELDQLLETLHEHGVLRFTNDLVAANPQVAKVLVDGLCKPGTLNAIQNVSVLAMMLSDMPPERFYKVTFAIKAALDAVGQHSPTQEGGSAPGVSGVYKMLNDDALWQAILPLVDGLKAFAERLDKDVDMPVSDYTGKATEGP